MVPGLRNHSTGFLNGDMWNTLSKGEPSRPGVKGWGGATAISRNISSRYVKKNDLVLIPGCGNAPFSPVRSELISGAWHFDLSSTRLQDMYDAGFVYQVCLDTSTVVVDQMTEWHNM